MTIESTVNTQARHKPRAPQKRVKKEFPAAVVKIVKEPVPSKKDEGWHYFWGEHINTGRKDWSILCKEDQVSWVLEQMESNVQLTEGFHFCDQRVKTENGYETRAILDEQFYLDEPEPEEDEPMHWAKPGNEVAVAQVDPPVVTNPIVVETLRRYDTLRQCWEAAGLKPTPDQLVEAMRTLNAGVLIDNSRKPFQ
tara:strand:+ start:11342 stop:11926 length:585 start_codon:yes stop_codon:yes gene_type:complete